MFAKDGYSNIAAAVFISLFLALIGYAAGPWYGYIFYGAAILLLAFILFFFRDPDRNVPADESLIIAPADGKVVFLRKVNEPVYIQGKATQISIFLSPLDVHVNRSPVTGSVEYIQYNPGKYLMAWDDRASSMNERADFGVRHPSGVKVFFRQITGFMARRIVYHLAEADRVQAGKRFGMMKFGSRMDILVPAGIKILIKQGDRTVGGETVLARIENAD